VYGHIYYNIVRPAPALLEAFREVSTAALSDAMGRHGAMSSKIRPIYEGIRMVGSALTVLCFPGDNIMTHKALQMVAPGDVLVIDDGDYDTGCFGHRSALLARSRGGVGVVASGSVRDVAMLRRDRFPTFCRGVSPRAPQKNVAGSINVPVHIGGIVICREMLSSATMTGSSWCRWPRPVKSSKRRRLASKENGSRPICCRANCRPIRRVLLCSSTICSEARLSSTGSQYPGDRNDPPANTELGADLVGSRSPG
jgi:regulator of RNase E activity RraA